MKSWYFLLLNRILFVNFPKSYTSIMSFDFNSSICSLWAGESGIFSINSFPIVACFKASFVSESV